MPFHQSDGHWIGSPQPLPVGELEIDEENASAIDAARRSLESGRPLMFDGAVGAGKTTIAHWLARELWRKDVLEGRYSAKRSDRTRATWLDEPYFWTTADAYVEDVMASWKMKFDHPADLYTPDGIAFTCRRLFVDDLGNEASTKARASERCGHITRLIVEREARGLPTWYTTNLSDEVFPVMYGLRAADRLRASIVGIVTVGGGSRRGAVA